MSQLTLSVLLRYGCAPVSLVLAVGSGLLVDPLLGPQFPFAVVLLAVLVTAWYGGFRPALLAVILGVGALDFFFLPPTWSFGLSSSELVGMILYGLTGLGIAMLGESMHQAHRALHQGNAALDKHGGAASESPPVAVDFRLLFESAPGMYLVLTTDFRIVAASDAYLRATMTERQKIESKYIFEVFPDNPNTPDATGVRNLRGSLERVLQLRIPDTMAVQKYDVRRPEADGGGFEERYWSPVNSPVFGRNNEVAYIIHRVDDVTAFVRQEEARTLALPLSQHESMEAEIVLRSQQLQEANQQLRAVNEQLRLLHEQLEQRVSERTRDLTKANEKLQATEELSRVMVQGVSSHAIFMLDPAGIVTNWNPGAERIKGYKAEEIVGQHFSRFYTPEDVTNGQPQLALQIATAKGYFEEEGLRVRKDGSRFWAIVAITAVYDHERHTLGFVKVTRDITLRKNLMTALEEATRLNRATLDGLSAHIAIVEEDGTIASVNEPWTRFGAANGLAPGHGSVGDNYLTVCEQSSGPYAQEGRAVADGIRAVLAGAVPQFSLEYPCHSPSEQRWFALRVTPFPGEGHRRVIVAHENITDRKRADLALRERERMLRIVTGSARVGLVVVNSEYRYLFANEAYAEIFGLNAGDIVNRHVPELIAAGWSQIQPRLDRALAGEMVTYELTLPPLRDGQMTRFFDVVYEPRTGDNEGPTVVVVVQEVTERKRSEIEQQKLISLIELSQDFIAVADPQGRLTFLNASGRKLIGLDDATDVGQLHFTDYVPPEWQDFFRDTVVVTTREQGHWEGEMQLCHLRTGERIDVFRSTFTLRNNEGQVSGYATVTRDITRQKRSQDALRASEERLRLMLEAVNDHAILMLDPSGNILTWSCGAERLSGYTADEILGRHVSCLFTPDDLASGLPGRELELATVKGQVSVEGWCLRKNGSQFWANGTLATLQDETRRVVGFVRITRDITAKRRNDELLQLILDHTLDGILSIDDRGTVAMINKAGQKLFGHPASEVVGQNVNRLMPEPYRHEHDSYITNYLRTGEARVIGIGREVQGLRKDGSTFPLELAVTEFRLDNQRHFVGIVRDISEKRRLEAEVRQAQKMEAFGQLAGGVAHDFNNLLTVISGFSEILLMSIPATDPKRASIKTISEAGERAAGLTRQLLFFSRQALVEMKVLDLNTEVKEMEKMLRRMIGEDIVLTSVLDPQLGKVMADPGLMGQVLMNLAVNARDAMPQGGKLTIETKNVELDAAYVNTHIEVPAGRYVLLSVSDTGTGMPLEVQSRVFEPFFTTKGVGKGTGLGLSVVHGIVKQSQGHIGVYSEVGLGTTFKLYLPRVADDSTAHSHELTPLSVSRGSETILLVEDEDAVREIALLALQTQGYNVLSAASGTEALQILDRRSGGIDILVTDVVMPEMSGRQLAETLQPRFPQMKVLYLSGYTDDAVVRHGILQAEVAFLQKPYTPTTLLRKVRQVLDHRK